MQRFTGSFFFISAGVLLAFTKSPDIYTVIAVLACAVVAGLASTQYSFWAGIGGGVLISVSLILQAVLSYRCMDCIKADILIMAGVIYLSIIEQSILKKHLRAMATVIAIIMLSNIALHYPSIGLTKAEAVQLELKQQITASAFDGRDVDLDTEEKPVLYYLPTCGACGKVMTELIKLDPEGKTWTPVQAGGDPGEGKEYLQKRGYRGEFYSQKWNGPVPALITTKEGKTKKTHDQEAIIKNVRGDND